MAGDPTGTLNPTIDFIAGTVAGITSLIVGFPFDTIKVRFQSPEIADKYTSTFNALTTILREERMTGLFRGITSPLATVALMNGLVFASYKFFLKLQLEFPDSVPTLAQVCWAGIGCGIVSSIITTPTELIKIREQTMYGGGTTTEITMKILQDSGIRGLYRGLLVTALRDCGYGIYFATYEATCRYFAKPIIVPDDPTLVVYVLSWWAVALAGALAGVIGWLVPFPLDVVKTRMQAHPMEMASYRACVGVLLVHDDLGRGDDSESLLHAYKNPYRTIITTIIYSYRTEGLGVFFHGLMPTLIRAIPVNIVTFATFELTVKLLSPLA
jgi:solute carrier family 25 carnitine/acylcarnitine transporter 20/29